MRWINRSLNIDNCTFNRKIQWKTDEIEKLPFLQPFIVKRSWFMMAESVLKERKWDISHLFICICCLVICFAIRLPIVIGSFCIQRSTFIFLLWLNNSSTLQLLDNAGGRDDTFGEIVLAGFRRSKNRLPLLIIIFFQTCT